VGRSQFLLSSLLLFYPVFARADDAPPVNGSAITTGESELVADVSNALQQDPALRHALAQRILQSSLATKLTDAQDQTVASEELGQWALEHPENAARLKIGFAKDDLLGSHDFEHALYVRIVRYFELNPEREKGLYGVIEKVGAESKSVLHQGSRLDEEQQHALLKKIFEGQGAGNHRTLPNPSRTSANSDPPAPPMSGSSVFGGSGIYDRLGAMHLTGYSPELLALQNSFNAEHIPGAPRIPESGRLDYATLAFPYYSLKNDLSRLESALMADQLRNLAGSSLTRDRQRSLELATRALENFKREVEKARQPSKITVLLLRSLGRLQSEAARWITVASLQGDLEHLLSLSVRWPDELLAEIRAVPGVDNQVRQAYVQEGQKLLDRVARVKDADKFAIDQLQKADFLARWPDIQKTLDQIAPLRRNLLQVCALYASLPGQMINAYQPKPWWKTWNDTWLVRFNPNSPYSRKILIDDQKWQTLKMQFERLASGNYL
jgi:hypothetical protein